MRAGQIAWMYLRAASVVGWCLLVSLLGWLTVLWALLVGVPRILVSLVE